MTSRPDRVVLAAFVVFVIFAGTNAIGVRFVLRETDRRCGRSGGRPTTPSREPSCSEKPPNATGSGPLNAHPTSTRPSQPR